MCPVCCQIVFWILVPAEKLAKTKNIEIQRYTKAFCLILALIDAILLFLL
jgi:hypothetical protein